MKFNIIGPERYTTLCEMADLYEHNALWGNKPISR